MKLGYIINDQHPLLESASNVKDIPNDDKPVLIYGYEYALKLFPGEAKLSTKIIDKQRKIYYCFSKEESEVKYLENFNNFLRYAFKELISGTRIVNIVNYNNVNFSELENKKVFLYETSKFITITCDKLIYYINKELVQFFNGTKLDSEKICNSLEGSEVYSWDTLSYFGAILKDQVCYKSKQQLRHLLEPYGDIDLYLGHLCLRWLQELEPTRSKASEFIWQRAYFIEHYLSQVKIKIDPDRLREIANLEENKMYENLLRGSRNGYVVQKYNGTDKTTGRIFPIDTGFSVQTLPKQFRDLIIAEPECLLVEFDYDYFEYRLLSQVCDYKLEGDPHSFISKLIFEDESYRKLGKMVNYSLLYGKSLDSTIKELVDNYPIKIDPRELKKKLKTISEPVKQLKDKLTEELEAAGYVINFLGRKIIPEKKHAILNNIIQSTAADVMIAKLVKIQEHLEKYNPSNKIILQNHDSVLLNLRIEDIENTELALEIKNILESPEHKLSGKVELKYGTNWAEVR